MRNIMIAATMTTLLLGCKKDESKDKDKGTSAGKAKSGGDPAAALPALTADAPLENIAPADKAPFESLAFRMTAERNEAGWPTYDAYNLGTKMVKFAAIQLYAYDKDGKQVAYTSTPLSWNGELAPGGKSDWAISVGSFDDKKVPASAVSYDVCYSSIKFDGDADSTDDSARCPNDKPKS